MNRDQSIQQLKNQESWDIFIIGGGATGLGICLDSALRAYKTLLVEMGDFAQGTSGKSTKLVHGGVRYLRQGNIGLVLEALKERGLFLKNAPHLSHIQTFIIPFYSWKDFILYSIGLRIYDLLAWNLGLGRTRNLNRKEVLNKLPEIKMDGLKGGILFYDGQFDDARMAINLAQSSVQEGACVLNYMELIGLEKDREGNYTRAELRDNLSQDHYWIHAKLIINAAGVFSDSILKLENPRAKPIIRPSQGVHLVLNERFKQSLDALMIPKTSDGRVLFMIPWHHKVVVGTTDTPVSLVELEPKPLHEEIEFILASMGEYLLLPPERKDIESCYVGLRPLAATDNTHSTQELSRSHKIWISEGGILYIIGGKWTTYRRMAEDCLDLAIKSGRIENRSCRTYDYKIHGYQIGDHSDYFSIYGSDKEKLLDLVSENPKWKEKIHPNYPFIEAEIIWAIREEMAFHLRDILSRRLRWLLLDVKISLEIAPRIVDIMALELKKNDSWKAEELKNYADLAQSFLWENLN